MLFYPQSIKYPSWNFAPPLPTHTHDYQILSPIHSTFPPFPPHNNIILSKGKRNKDKKTFLSLFKDPFTPILDPVLFSLFSHAGRNGLRCINFVSDFDDRSSFSIEIPSSSVYDGRAVYSCVNKAKALFVAVSENVRQNREKGSRICDDPWFMMELARIRLSH